MHVRCVAACLVVVILAAGPLSGTALAQPKGVFIPLLVYRTGPYAPSGIPQQAGSRASIGQAVDSQHRAGRRPGGRSEQLPAGSDRI